MLWCIIGLWRVYQCPNRQVLFTLYYVPARRQYSIYRYKSINRIDYSRKVQSPSSSSNKVNKTKIFTQPVRHRLCPPRVAWALQSKVLKWTVPWAHTSTITYRLKLTAQNSRVSFLLTGNLIYRMTYIDHVMTKSTNCWNYVISAAGYLLCRFAQNVTIKC